MDDVEVQKLIELHMIDIQEKFGEEAAVYYGLGFSDGIIFISNLVKAVQERNHEEQIERINHAFTRTRKIGGIN